MERGILVRWQDEKGFGFIKPQAGKGKDVFIHISALKHMARKPVVGDAIQYQTEQQADGKVKAIKASIEGVAVVASTSKRSSPSDQNRNSHSRPNRQSKSSSRLLIPLLVILGLGIFGFKKYEAMTATPVITNEDIELMQWQPAVASFRCEAGKQHCSQMRSCAEAKYYLSNYPDTKMDGDGDGTPCESQHCGY